MAFKLMLMNMVKKVRVDITEYNLELDELMRFVKEKKTTVNALPPTVIEQAKDQIYAAKEAIMLRKVNVVGLKMKIYLERLKAINAIEFLKKIKGAKFEEFQGKDEFKKCIKYNKAIKKAIEEDADKYRQYHLKMDSVTSAVLGYITAAMYLNADLWEATNVLTMSNYLLMKKLNKYDRMLKSISHLYDIFKELQKTDYDVLYKKHQNELAAFTNSQQKFIMLEKIATTQLEELEGMVTENYKEDKPVAELEVSDKMNEMILDNIMLRKLLYNANRRLINIYGGGVGGGGGETAGTEQ